ncbi:YoaK family protein [Methylobacterium durans]|uniref:YoaK family protein n=1 Tax=Methylobacterium durans TaxID=2202825 RepID=UPI002AFE76B3|nr:YoaK family protein [Methylobacterium durans]MEA1831791.1 YoaK family protein [Methylobacterium durans]
MKRSSQLAYGLVLTATAGYVDALGFVRLGGLYTSFMSGNTTQFSVALGHGEWRHAILPCLLVGMFLIGSVLGSGLSLVVPARWATPVVLAFEALAVLGALSLGIATPDLGLAALFMALAMGAQNAVLVQVQGFRAGTTFVTGALFSLGQKIALALTGRGPRYGWVGDGAVWLALLCGALGGAVAYGSFGLLALILPAAVTSAFAISAALHSALRPVEKTA